MSLLGLDVGSSVCKAAAFAADGRCLAEAARGLTTRTPAPGRFEMNAAEVFAGVLEAVAEAAGLARAAGDPVTAIGVSSMGEAAVPVSTDREVLGPAILMADHRGGEYVERFSGTIGQEAFYAINPNILAPSYTMPKLCWLRDHEPGLYRRTDRFLHFADLVVFLLGGRAVTNYSHANRTLLFDLRAEDWSDELLDLAGLDREKLAPCVPSGTVAGSVTPELAERLGLPADVALVVGGHDQCLNALGGGLVSSGRAVCGIGTYECITPVYGRAPDDAGFLLAHGLNVEHHVLDGLYVSFLYNAGGALVKWFVETFAAADRDRLGPGGDIHGLLAGEMPSEPTALLALPHFEMTGPPHFTADSAGAFVGLHTSTTRGEMFKSLLESETFYFVDGVRALGELGVDVSEFVATGGGARSDAWLQIKADIFGVPFVRPEVTEASTLGAALLAGLATGVLASPGEAAGRFVRPDRTFEPDASRHAIYQDRLADYRRLYPALKDLLADQAHPTC